MFTTDYQNDSCIVTDTDAPHVRHIVIQDTDTDCPASYGDYDVYVYRASYRSGTDESRAGERVESRAFFDLMDRFNDEEYVIPIVKRYMRIFHDVDLGDSITTYSARGYSQSDWWDVLVVCDDTGTDAGACAREWEQWARGDVYYVYPEQYVPCPHPESCHAITRCAHWSREPLDYAGMGGIYADDAIEAVKHYLSQW